MANTIRAFAFLRRELEDIGIVVNTSKTVALLPKGHAPTAEDISLLEGVDVRIVDEEEVTAVGVPIGTDEYLVRPRASKGGSSGGRHGPPCTLPRQHAGQTSGGPHRHRIPRAED